MDKFVDPDLWANVNLSLARLYSHRAAVESIDVWSAPALSRPSFAEMLAATSSVESAASAWSPTSVGSSFGPSWSTHWFRLRSRVPAEWVDPDVGPADPVSSASRTRPRPIHLLWNSASEAAVWTRDGKLMQGLTGGDGGDRRTEFILKREHCIGEPAASSSAPFSASPSLAGCTFELYIEMAANGMFGVGSGFIGPPEPDRSFTLSVAELGWFDPEYARLRSDFGMVRDMAKALTTEEKKPSSARGLQALRVGNEVINALRVNDRVTWPAAQSLLRSYLSATLGSAAPTIHAVGHCHIDTAWLWPYAETRRKVARSWATQLDLMERHPHYRFAASQAQQYAWLKEDNPELFERVRSAVGAGRFVPVGGSWVEADANLPCGESLIRQMIYGQAFFQREFGIDPSNATFWLPDTFGYCAQMPQLLRGAGFTSFLTQKISWSLLSTFPHHSFRWEGLDGTRILTHFPPADDYNSKADVAAILKNSVNNRDRAIADHSLMLFGHGDGGGGPDFKMIDNIDRLADCDGLQSRIRHSTPAAFFDQLRANESELAVWSGELYLELHRGTYTTGGAIKLANRQCEFVLKELEIWSSIGLLLLSETEAADSALIDAVYPAAEIERLWKLVLTNQFHDVLPASCIKLAMDDALTIYHRVWLTGFQMMQRAMQRVASLTQGATAAQAIAASADAAAPSSSSSSSVAPALQLHTYPSFPLLDLGLCTAATSPAADPALTRCLLFNALSFDRAGIVTVPAHVDLGSEAVTQLLSSGERLVHVSVQGLSMTSLVNAQSLAAAAAPQLPVSVQASANGSFVFRNAFCTATIASSGRLVSFVDLSADRELIDCAANDGAGGNHLVLYDDVPFFWDAWDVELYHLQKRESVAVASSIRIVEAGPLRATLELTFQLSSLSTLTQRVSLDCLSMRLEFRCECEWRESHRFLKVEFSTVVRSPSGLASFEIQHGFVSRPTPANLVTDLAKFESCAHRWVDLSDGSYGVALLSDSKYGWAVHESTLRLSLLRATKKPDDQIDMGRHQFGFAFLPHAGSTMREARVIQTAAAFNQPIRVATAAAAATLSGGSSIDSGSVLTAPCPSFVRLESSVRESLAIDVLKKVSAAVSCMHDRAAVHCVAGQFARFTSLSVCALLSSFLCAVVCCQCESLPSVLFRCVDQFGCQSRASLRFPHPRTARHAVSQSIAVDLIERPLEQNSVAAAAPSSTSASASSTVAPASASAGAPFASRPFQVQSRCVRL